MGDATSTAAGFQLGAGLATPIAAPLATMAIFGAGATSSTAAAAGTTAALGGLAVPLVGAAIAGVTLLVTHLIQNSGCGPTCIQASDYANQAEPLLRQNLSAYMALPVPRSQSAQKAALANFDNIWAQLVKLWSDQSLGNAGKRGISDRQAGSCKWKDANGSCWNWFVGYRDPIANDPNVVPDTQAALSSSAGPVSLGGMGVSTLGLLALAGLVIAGVYLL